jgi:hypothetical protein
MYVVVFSIVTNPVLTAASVFCVTIFSVAVTDQPSGSISSAHAIDCCVLLKIVPFGFLYIFHITFSSTVLNSVVDSASPCLKPLSMPNTSVKCPWIFTLRF